jgi:hypothetical protein
MKYFEEAQDKALTPDELEARRQKERAQAPTPVKQVEEKAVVNPYLSDAQEWLATPTVGGLVDLAFDSGILPNKTRDALLVIRAADAARVATDKAEEINKRHIKAQENKSVKSEHKASEEDRFSVGDPLFDGVRSGAGTAPVQKAQAIRAAAQLVLNNEIDALNEAVTRKFYDGPAFPAKEDAFDGLRTAVSSLFHTAAEMLTEEGHREAGLKYHAVADALAPEKKGSPPSEAVFQIEWNIGRYYQDQYIFSNDPNHLLKSPYQEFLEQVMDATKIVDPYEAKRPKPKAKADTLDNA